MARHRRAERPRLRRRLWSAALVVTVALSIVVLRLVEDIGPERRPGDRWTVVRVVDGDTVELLGGDILRLLSIDTPERGEPLYEEASDLLARLALNQQGGVVFASERRDSYGRLLGYLYVDTLLINKVMIDSGLAHLYLFNRSELGRPEVQQMLEAQAGAVERRAGLWSIPYTPESYYIASQNSFRFHRPGCRYVDDLTPERYRRLSDREAALLEGLSPCRVCEP